MIQELLPAGRWTVLALLWAEGASGSVHSLARQAGLSYSSAYAELKRLERAGLARARPVGNAVLYEADRDHPEAESVQSLVRFSADKKRRHAAHDPDEVLAQLVALGAPFPGSSPLATQDADRGRPMVPEEAIAQGLRLARSHPALTRAFPVLLARNRQRLDLEKLKERAAALGEKQTLGFFLDLTGLLASDPGLRAFARTLRDRRRKTVHDFFDPPAGKRAARLAEQRTPKIARDWLFRLDLDLTNFRNFFLKFAGA